MTDQPSIAERVRFWQEQDRINKSLIPRVLKLHERLVKLETQDLNVSPLIAALDSRLTAEQNAVSAALRREMTGLADNVDRRLDQLRAEVVNRVDERLRTLRRLVLILGGSALAAALIGLAVAILR